MTAHAPHPPRDENGRPFLIDDCPRCREHSENLGITLTPEAWQRMWRLMLLVEFDEGSYKSTAESHLGRGLYTLYLVLQRNTLVDPDRLLTGIVEQASVERAQDFIRANLMVYAELAADPEEVVEFLRGILTSMEAELEEVER